MEKNYFIITLKKLKPLERQIFQYIYDHEPTTTIEIRNSGIKSPRGKELKRQTVKRPLERLLKLKLISTIPYTGKRVAYIVLDEMKREEISQLIFFESLWKEKNIPTIRNEFELGLSNLHTIYGLEKKDFLSEYEQAILSECFFNLDEIIQKLKQLNIMIKIRQKIEDSKIPRDLFPDGVTLELLDKITDEALNSDQILQNHKQITNDPLRNPFLGYFPHPIVSWIETKTGKEFLYADIGIAPEIAILSTVDPRRTDYFRTSPELAFNEFLSAKSIPDSIVNKGDLMYDILLFYYRGFGNDADEYLFKMNKKLKNIFTVDEINFMIKMIKKIPLLFKQISEMKILAQWNRYDELIFDFIWYHVFTEGGIMYDKSLELGWQMYNKNKDLEKISKMISMESQLLERYIEMKEKKERKPGLFKLYDKILSS